MTFEDEVRELAYYIWEDAGHPEGKEVEIWLAAELLRRSQLEALKELQNRRFDLADRATRLVYEEIQKEEDTNVFAALKKAADEREDRSNGEEGLTPAALALPTRPLSDEDKAFLAANPPHCGRDHCRYCLNPTYCKESGVQCPRLYAQDLEKVEAQTQDTRRWWQKLFGKRK
jgi:hypothetical protein